MKLNLRPAILARFLFVFKNIYLSEFDIVDEVVLTLVDILDFTGHRPFLFHLFVFSLCSFFYSSYCPSNFEHFTGYEYCIGSSVNMIGFLFSFSLSLPFSSLCRGGSLEKDKAVSSSIVSSVQSKITQVLFFAFIPNISSTALYSPLNTHTECCFVFPSCKEDTEMAALLKFIFYILLYLLLVCTTNGCIVFCQAEFV